MSAERITGIWKDEGTHLESYFDQYTTLSVKRKQFSGADISYAWECFVNGFYITFCKTESEAKDFIEEFAQDYWKSAPNKEVTAVVEILRELKDGYNRNVILKTSTEEYIDNKIDDAIKRLQHDKLQTDH